MKNTFILLLIAISLWSCEEVIEVELDTTAPRLVIDASINILLDDGSVTPKIKLSETAPFFGNEVPPVTNAIVSITSDNNEVFMFEHQGDGEYTTAIVPQLGVNYTLKIIHNDETYTATTSLQTVVPLEEVTQNNEGGFTGDMIEVEISFTDPSNENNYYFFEGLSDRGDLRDSFSDEFFSGNTFQAIYFADDIEPDDVISFSLYGVDEQFYNFMFALLQQSSDGGGPFETQPATIRGNIINETNTDNYPLGYFRISELSKIVYTVE
ncbi:hypothetical protein ULMS_13270 [Patiriisocius marinistellae]|uniref:DUF4249 domain-containing protein n=1 Tax=Patiriisocius marinistellae TaxID=2494560 RepID=A0A5J4G010_9FLAO|nr:DUF4249 domain-containing protein [Patiriisocius marinistellae]GEQ85819.1 hypothetical protein ULMS_13270 [Patiriisocius marinistellae]